MFHRLLIHLPFEGHMDCFQFLMTMNKTGINLCVQYFCENIFLFQLYKYLGEELLGHTVSLIL